MYDWFPLLLWFLIVFVTLLIALGRFTVPGRRGFSWEGSYEAFAHLWCGVLIGVSLASPDFRTVCLISLTTVSAFEVVMFLRLRLSTTAAPRE